jgi:hypothetical protein
LKLHSNSKLGEVFLMSLPYQPLPAGSHFRLLELQGGSNEDPIACRLRVEGIPDESTPSTGPRYEALSYAWGSPNPTHQIIINGWPYTIRQNLWSFLKHKRNPTTHSTLWIDALCTYSHRTTMNYFEYLRFVPQFFEGFNFTYLASQIW